SIAVLDAVVELCRCRPPRERDKGRAQPLRRPVERHGLMPVPQHGRKAFPAVETQIREPACESRGPLAQLDEAEAHFAVDERLAFRMPLGRILEAAGEVHGLPATSAIASTIGS